MKESTKIAIFALVRTLETRDISGSLCACGRPRDRLLDKATRQLLDDVMAAVTSEDVAPIEVEDKSDSTASRTTLLEVD